jgi:hypothetical protein
LSKVADGKRTTGYADEDFTGAIWQQQRSYTEEEMKLFARSYFREIKLDTTNTLWTTLLTGVLRNLKKSKLKTTIHYLVVGDLLGNNANSYHPTYFTIEEALLAGKKSISTEIKKDGYDAKWRSI